MGNITVAGVARRPSTGTCKFVGVSPQAVRVTFGLRIEIVSAERITLTKNAVFKFRHGELTSTLTENAVLDIPPRGGRLGGANLGFPAAAS